MMRRVERDRDRDDRRGDRGDRFDRGDRGDRPRGAATALEFLTNLKRQRQRRRQRQWQRRNNHGYGHRNPAGRARPFFRRRKSCPFSGANAPKIDYKDVKLLQRLRVGARQDRSQPASRRSRQKSSANSRQAIKRSRFLGLPALCDPLSKETSRWK